MPRSYRGLSPGYWYAYWRRWLTDAFLCRYGHQNIFDLRPELRRCFTALDKAFFREALLEHVEAEMKRRDPFAPPSED